MATMMTFGRQLSTYWVLANYIKRNGHSPTRLELSRLRNLNVKALEAHIRELEQRGYVRRDPPRCWRNLKLTGKVPT